MKLFSQKKCKIFERWGLRPHTPMPPAAGGFAPKPPAPIGLRRLGASPPDPPNSPPIANFWLRACASGVVSGARPASLPLIGLSNVAIT